MGIELKENQIRQAIVNMNNSKEYLALKKYFSEESVLKTLGVSRDEKAHSNFIKWLLSPGSNHDLGFVPIKKFLRMLSSVVREEYNEKSFFPVEYYDKFLFEDYVLCEGSKVMAEEPTGKVAGFIKEGRIDILIHLKFKNSNKILPIIIENKVLSTENKEDDTGTKMQTQKYYNWGVATYGNSQYEKPIYVFLAPDVERDIKCSCEAFIKVSYQNLVDYVIEPCLIATSTAHAKFLIEDYLRCLSNSTLDKPNSVKESKIMAFTDIELELLRKFHEKNKDLFDAVLTMLEHDSEDADERKIYREAREGSISHDHSKYSFNGKTYFKGPLLVAIVERYIDEHPGVSVSDLKTKFDISLVFNKKPIILLPSETPAGLKKKAKEKMLPDGVTNIYINNQVQIGDMEEFLRIVKSLDYDVIKL
jgi:hypothetical protein